MNRIITLLLLAASPYLHADDNITLPSDEEMLRKGRVSVNESMPAFDNAAKGIGQPAQLNLPPETLRQSPLAKELSNEMFSSDIKKASPTANGTDLILFVSFSIPDDDLAEYSRQAREAGAIIVLRGMYQNSVNKTQQRAYLVNKELAQWDINPGVFRKFKVDRVPALILADARQSEVVENGCAQPSSFLRVDGKISIRQALLLMRQRADGPLAADAAARLAKLERQQ